jgi:hypothetical protein
MAKQTKIGLTRSAVIPNHFGDGQCRRYISLVNHCRDNAVP